MNNEAKKRVQDLFEGMEENTLSATDPEWVDIVANFSQNETVKESKLTQKEQMLCILSALLGCQGLGEYQNLLYAALKSGVDPVLSRKPYIRQPPILVSDASTISSLPPTGSWKNAG